MKNVKIYFLSLLMFVLTACSLQKNLNTTASNDDDVFWSKKDDPGKPLTVDDLERQERKHKGPSSAYPQYEPINQAPAEDHDNNARAQAAYDSWNQKRGATTSGSTSGSTSNYNNNLNSSNQSNTITDNYYDNQNSRRYGSQRSYYYNDPYYNSLSSNWGWTSLYSPMVRPGYYNWAPGWNVGFGYNNFGGGGYGMSYGMSYGMGYGMGWGGMSPGYGYGMFNPWYGYGYSPYSYNPWGYPYGFGYGYPYYGYGYGAYGYNGYHNGYGSNGGYGNDVVTNRPLLRPRNSMGSSIPSSSHPRNYTPDDHSVRPNSGVSPAGPQNGQITQPINSRPNSPSTGNVYTPERPAPASGLNPSTNRPGGELLPDGNGRPVYVSPNSRPAMNSNNVNTTRPGGDLVPGPNGSQVYMPARGSSNYGNNNGNGGVEPSSNYQPSRGNNNYNSNPSYNSPSRNQEPSYNEPSRYNSPTYSAPSRTYSSPTYSAPSPGRSYGGGSGGGGGSSGGGGGGGGGSRSRPR